MVAAPRLLVDRRNIEDELTTLAREFVVDMVVADSGELDGVTVVLEADMAGMPSVFERRIILVFCAVRILSRLRPDGRYRCEGAEQSELVADATGRARVTVALDGRTELRVYPVE